MIEAGNIDRAHEVLSNFLDSNSELQNQAEFAKETLEIKRLLAVTYEKKGEYENALELAEKVRDSLVQIVGPSHFKSLVASNTLAIILSKVGREKQSFEITQGILANLDTEGNLQAGTLTMLTNLGTNLNRQGKHSEALSVLERASAGFEKLLGKIHPRTLSANGILGQTPVSYTHLTLPTNREV